MLCTTALIYDVLCYVVLSFFLCCILYRNLLYYNILCYTILLLSLLLVTLLFGLFGAAKYDISTSSCAFSAWQRQQKPPDHGPGPRVFPLRAP